MYQTAPTTHFRKAFKWSHLRKNNRGVGRCEELPMVLYSDTLNTKSLALLEISNNILNDEELLSILFIPLGITGRL